MPHAAPPAAADPFLFDAERLQALSSEPVVRRGVAYFKENRIVDLGWNGVRVWAAVEGTGPGPYQVELSLDEEGELVVDCDCPFDWEPACKHAVATLLAYGARQPVSEGQRAGAARQSPQALPVNGGDIVPGPPEPLRHPFSEILVELQLHDALAPASSM
jgi:uncharacterized Zn finger protein